jgi:hypothetical protein
MIGIFVLHCLVLRIVNTDSVTLTFWLPGSIIHASFGPHSLLETGPVINSRVVDPDSMTSWIRIRIGDPGSRSKKMKKNIFLTESYKNSTNC